MNLNYSSYKSENFVCSHCKWKGKGEGLSSEYHPYSNILGLGCPKCSMPIGHVQFPINEGKPYDEEEDKKYW